MLVILFITKEPISYAQRPALSTKQPPGEILYKSGIRRYNGRMQDPVKIEQFVRACRKVAEYGLVSCSSGNLSWRIEPGVALLSGSGSWLAELTAEQVAVCEIESARCLNGKEPTCESVFHLGILKNRPEMSVVLHFQTPYATAIACGESENLNFNVLFEVPVYIGAPVTVPCLLPGSEALAQATIKALADRQTHIAILKNHGLVTVGRDFNDAIQKAVFFELACRILLTNSTVEPLAAEMIKQLSKDGAKA